ncbi:MAG: glycerol-3-phosphate 1-O-acyltransferase PlsY [Pseudomonadota bacterium]
MIYLYQIVFLVLTYFLSAIPFGVVLAKFFGKQDIRQAGSGNIGATNVARVLGKRFGLATLILDGIKGAIMVIGARYLFVDAKFLNIFLALVGAVAVVAHIFPIYLNFKGGKGVATSLAVLLVINPAIGFVGCFAWIIIFAFTRTSAIASLSAILITVIFSFYSNAFLEEILLSIFLAVLIFIRHRENIERILNDQEHKFKKSNNV